MSLLEACWWSFHSRHRAKGAVTLVLALVLAAACSDPVAPRADGAAPARLERAAAEPGAMALVGAGAGRCLDVAGARRDPGAPVILYACNGGANQQFTFPAPGATGEIRVYAAEGTPLCVDVAGAAGQNGDAVITWTCHGGANQQWTRTAAGELRGLNGRCLDVAGAGTEDFSDVILWDCHGGSNQRWTAGGPEAAPASERRTLAVGSLHSCALTAAGAAYCWGQNSYGQLGDGSSTTRAIPVAVAGAPAFTEIVAGAFHTCALTAEGAAWCWGYGHSGNLGDGTTTYARPTPAPVAGGHRFVELAAGRIFTCGRRADGVALCWGNDLFGQLGDDPAFATRTTPTPVAGGHAFVALDAGDESTCAVRTDGAAFCWGRGQNGQLGIDNGFVAYQPTPAPVRGATRFRTIGVGEFAGCALTDAGVAHCWGSNVAGETGLGTFDGYSFDPRPVVMPAGVAAFRGLRVGDEGHVCALAATDGTAYCWGHNTFGQLGDGSLAARNVPTRVADADRYAVIAPGGVHTCGITTAGAAKCWGLDDAGQLGDGSPGRDRVTTPRPVAGGLTFAVP